MEWRFGHDFSQVKVHSDARAAESARGVNALAYTVGRDIVFGAGQYTPKTTKGRRLLAHELTHVLQQRGANKGGGIGPRGASSALALQFQRFWGCTPGITGLAQTQTAIDQLIHHARESARGFIKNAIKAIDRIRAGHASAKDKTVLRNNLGSLPLIKLGPCVIATPPCWQRERMRQRILESVESLLPRPALQRQALANTGSAQTPTSVIRPTLGNVMPRSPYQVSFHHVTPRNVPDHTKANPGPSRSGGRNGQAIAGRR